MCSISAEKYTGTTIEQNTQQAVPCDIHCNSKQYPLITVLCVLAQLMIFVHMQHACYILLLLQWKWSCFLSLYSIVPASVQDIYSGIFYSCQFIKSFRSFHSFWEEEDLPWKISTSFTEWHHYHIMGIQFQHGFRVIQPTVQWPTFKTFMFVFINSCSS